jgi:hypothetical protein
MRAISIIATMGVLVFAALTLVPETSAYHAMLSIAALVCGALALIAIAATRHRAPPVRDQRPPAEAPRPPAAALAANQADAEVVNFLATMQQRGRLVDFLMDDITAYSDAQVGAAARVVHGGCSAVLKEHLRVRPVREENEGAAIEVPGGYRADEYRLVGTVRGSPPFTGVLVHRGWRVEEINLPRLLRPDEDRLPTIAPAEVELK